MAAGAAPIAEPGRMLGRTGVNQTGVDLVEVKRRHDEMSAPQRREVVPAVITVFGDRSFELRLRTPPTAFPIRRAPRP
jgi:large subunit ribosomal protein L11